MRSFAYAKDDIKGFVKKIEGFVMFNKAFLHVILLAWNFYYLVWEN